MGAFRRRIRDSRAHDLAADEAALAGFTDYAFHDAAVKRRTDEALVPIVTSEESAFALASELAGEL